MNKKIWIYTAVACALMVAFSVLSMLLISVDVRAAGESQAPVGLATVNEAVWQAIGQNKIALTVSTVGGLTMIAALGAFGVTGLVQVIRRKGILRADKPLYVMAGGCVAFAAAYVFFEKIVLCYRPILEDGELAASYPSSHAMLAVTIAGMGTAYVLSCVQKKGPRIGLCAVLNTVAVATVVCRLLAGVHWLTDIVGGVLLGLAITFVYLTVCAMLNEQGERA